MTKTTGSNAAKINNGVNVDALVGARGARAGARGCPVQPSYFNRSCHE